MALTFSVNGWSSTNIGLSVLQADTRRNFPAREWTGQAVPGKAPRVLMDSQPAYEARVLEMECHLSGADSTTFLANRDEFVSRVDRLGAVDLRFSGSTDRQFFARLRSMDHDRLTQASLTDDQVSVAFDLLEPWAYGSTQDSVTGIGSTFEDIPLGTAPTFRASLTVNGPTTGTGFTVEYRDVDSIVQKTVAFSTVTLSSTESITLDMNEGTVTDQGDSDRVADFSSTSDFPWPLDPRDGEHWNSNWPQLRVDTGTMSVTYRKSYGGY